jgi:hypothetical protein
MFLKSGIPGGKKEQTVIENINRHIKLLCSACECFKTAFENTDTTLMRTVIDMEREGDSIRREIVSNIYEGAFLPYLRPDLCKFVEMVDDVFDMLEDTALQYLDIKLHESIEGDCTRIVHLNLKSCEMLLFTFQAMLKGEDLREKTLAVRIYEKKVDDIKFDLLKKMTKIDIKNFWEGKLLSDFISNLTSITDAIEDASDYLQLINVSMR